MTFPVWLMHSKADHLEYFSGDWGVRAFLAKHDNKWITCSKDNSYSPALYLVRLWQRDAMEKAKRLAWGDPGGYYEALAKRGYEIATSDDYPLCEKYLHYWQILNED